MNDNWLKELVKALVAANAAIPVIIDSVAAFVLIFKAATGAGPSVAERAAIIREQVATNAAYGKAALEEIDALLGVG